MECVRLPPEIIRAIEKTISAGGAAKVRLIRGAIRVQVETAHLVKEKKVREE